MKLLVISAAFPPMKVGEADHALHLCQRLSEHGLDVHVLTTKGAAPTTLRVPFNVYPIMQRWLWPDLPRLALFIRRCAPNAILLIFTDRDYDYHPMIMFAPLVAKVLLPRTSFVTQLETQFLTRRVSIFTQAALKGMARMVGPKYLDYAYGTLLCRSDRVILLSEDHRQKYLNVFTKIEDKTLVIPPAPIIRVIEDDNGMWRQRARDDLGIKTEGFLLAYFGYIYPDKGIETLFKALSLVKKSNMRLVIIGGGLGSSHDASYPGTLRRLAEELSIGDRVAWTGEYESDSVTPSMYLRGADACVLPFDNGVTLNRSSFAAATVHGLPIITTRGQKLESPFRDNENVLLCPTRDPESLAAAIDRLQRDEALRNRLHHGSLALAEEFFSWDKTVTQTIEALSHERQQ